MKNYSPLRYPGGKSSMAGLLTRIRKLNELGDKAIAEPFAGGAGASLGLLLLEETSEIFINDVDKSIYDFWWSVTNRSKHFLELLSSKRVSMAEWRRQRDIYRQKRPSKLSRGFATFYLNRCNHSGIIMNGGPIGGIAQNGEWKLGARYNKQNLRARCERIFDYRTRIHVSNQDGIEFISQKRSKKPLFFIDPPYFNKGKTLYLNALDTEYHTALSEKLRTMQDAAWVLTYDDCPEIRRLYRGWSSIKPFSLRYAAAERRQGKEILITPKWMRLPSYQESNAITW